MCPIGTILGARFITRKLFKYYVQNNDIQIYECYLRVSLPYTAREQTRTEAQIVVQIKLHLIATKVYIYKDAG